MKLAGKVLTESVLTEIGNLSLDVSNCHAHGYDEAGSVSGHINGLSANILRINKKAVYTHHSEKLNLVAATCSIQCVRNVPDQIKDRSFFFTFTKPRQKMLNFSIENHAPDCLKKKLTNVCHTRWVEQIIVLDDCEGLFISISLLRVHAFQ